jgi:SRSO17 transposase
MSGNWVAVSLSLANHHGSLPVAYRLYLPKDWITDRARRKKVGVPDSIGFKTKPEIALEGFAGPAQLGFHVGWG